MSSTSLLGILAVAFALGCDAFTVGLAVGTRLPGRRAAFRLWFHFGLFQFLMPLGGWYIGSSASGLVQAYDHWCAFALLAAISARMFYESTRPVAETLEKLSFDPTRGWSLVGLSLATSMDAFGVGFGMGIAASTIVMPAVAIGIIAGIMTYLGIRLGRVLSLRFGKRVEMLGALVLLLIAVKLLWI